MRKITLTMILMAVFAIDAYSQYAVTYYQNVDRCIELGVGNTFSTFLNPMNDYVACDYRLLNPTAYLGYGATVQMLGLGFETQLFGTLSYSQAGITMYKDLAKTDKYVLRSDILALNLHFLICKLDIAQDMELALGIKAYVGLTTGDDFEFGSGPIPEVKYNYMFSDKFYLSASLSYNFLISTSKWFGTSFNTRYYTPLEFSVGIGTYWD